MGRRLDIEFDLDVGELVNGHRVLLRGIELSRPVQIERWRRDSELRAKERMEHRRKAAGDNVMDYFSIVGPLSDHDREVVEIGWTEPELHYEFIPALHPHERLYKGENYWYWMLHCTDDVGTQYLDHNNGSVGTSHGERDLGGQIPPEAHRLFIEFKPPSGWEPPEPWCRRVTIDLVERPLLGD